MTGKDSLHRAYEAAVTRLSEMLDELEERLSVWRYLIGDRIKEADWRLFTTLVRFDYRQLRSHQTSLLLHPLRHQCV